MVFPYIGSSCPDYIPADPDVLLESGGIWQPDEHALRQRILADTSNYIHSDPCCIEADGSGKNTDTEGRASRERTPWSKEG